MRQIFLFCILAVVFGWANSPVAALSPDSNSLRPDISGSILINVYEEYGKKGFVEYTLSFPNAVMKESNSSKVGSIVKHNLGLSMLSSEYFADSYETKKHNCNGITDEKTIASLAGNELIYTYDCNKVGQRIAFSSAIKQFADQSILTVKDIANKNTMFKLDLGNKSIVDIAWNPNGRYVAILSAVHTYSYNPLALLITIAGHPVGYRSYFLDLFDIDGNRIYQSKENDIGTFSAGRGSGVSAIVWIDNEDRK